jgi:DNA-binding NtrC family response regulator
VTKVLYVEDNDDNVFMLKMRLELLGDLALSAHALAGEREKALAAGCNEFDTKPIEFDRLVATLRRILASHK